MTRQKMTVSTASNTRLPARVFPADAEKSAKILSERQQKIYVVIHLDRCIIGGSTVAQPGELNDITFIGPNISLYKCTLETVDISRNLGNEKNVLSIRRLSGGYQEERKAEVGEEL